MKISVGWEGNGGCGWQCDKNGVPPSGLVPPLQQHYLSTLDTVSVLYAFLVTLIPVCFHSTVKLISYFCESIAIVCSYGNISRSVISHPDLKRNVHGSDWVASKQNSVFKSCSFVQWV